MLKLTIKKGDSSSESYPLAHKQLAAILAPHVSDEVLVSIYGSFDGESFAPLFNENKPIAFATKKTPLLHIFTPSDFAGVMYIKYVLEGYTAKADLDFPTYLVEG